VCQLFQFFICHRRVLLPIMHKTKATNFLRLIAFGLVIYSVVMTKHLFVTYNPLPYLRHPV
jgi:hypothetical protein